MPFCIISTHRVALAPIFLPLLKVVNNLLCFSFALWPPVLGMRFIPLWCTLYDYTYRLSPHYLFIHSVTAVLLQFLLCEWLTHLMLFLYEIRMQRDVMLLLHEF